VNRMQFIDAEKACAPVAMLCRLVDVSRAGVLRVVTPPPLPAGAGGCGAH
jgi:hypothetical protein